MKTRPLSELYQLLLTENKYTFFLCNRIKSLYSSSLIDIDELVLLKNHFNRNKPTKKLHPEFYDADLKNREQWWDCSDKEVRDKFINKMITITKNDHPNTIQAK